MKYIVFNHLKYSSRYKFWLSFSCYITVYRVLMWTEVWGEPRDMTWEGCFSLSSSWKCVFCYLKEGKQEAFSKTGIVLPSRGCTTLPVHIWRSPTAYHLHPKHHNPERKFTFIFLSICRPKKGQFVTVLFSLWTVSSYWLSTRFIPSSLSVAVSGYSSCNLPI